MVAIRPNSGRGLCKHGIGPPQTTYGCAARPRCHRASRTTRCSSVQRPLADFLKDGRVTSVRVDSQLAITINEGATASAVAGLGIAASSENSARAELEAGQLVRVLPDWDFGSMEVNALFVSGKTIKPAARAFADFLLRELRAA